MKNLKSIIYLTLILLITACTSDNDNLKVESQQIDYQELNLGLKENIISFNKMIEYDESLKQKVYEYRATGNELVFQRITTEKAIRQSEEESVNYKKEDLSDVYSERQKKFLIDFYNKLANSEDGNILDIVIEYKNSLINQGFSTEEYEQINTLLVASEQSILVLDGIIETGEDAIQKSSFSSRGSDCGFWCCMRKKAGKAIGRGIVTGAIVGGIRGAIVGAGGGTVALPGIGTVTGAVGGAVFGAASGAVIGATTNAIWQAVDCGGGRALHKLLRRSKSK